MSVAVAVAVSVAAAAMRACRMAAAARARRQCSGVFLSPSFIFSHYFVPPRQHLFFTFFYGLVYVIAFKPHAPSVFRVGPAHAPLSPHARTPRVPALLSPLPASVPSLVFSSIWLLM